MKKYLYYILLFVCVLAFGSCKRELSFFRVKASHLVVDTFHPEQLALKAKLNVENEQQSAKAVLDIRLITDSILWVSLRSGSGIEGSRMLIIPDSAIILNRISKTYEVYNYEMLSEKLHIVLNFSILQAIILGNPPWLIGEAKHDETPTHFEVHFTQGDWAIDYSIGRNTHKIETLHAYNNLTKAQITVAYSDFQPIGSDLFVRTLKVNETHQQNGQVFNNLFLINFVKADTTAKRLKLNFKIPSKYEKNQLK